MLSYRILIFRSLVLLQDAPGVKPMPTAATDITFRCRSDWRSSRLRVNVISTDFVAVLSPSGLFLELVTIQAFKPRLLIQIIIVDL